MPPPRRPRGPLTRAVLQAAALALVGGGLGLLANLVHPMGLPLTLARVPRPGVPEWVWRKVARVDAAEARRQWAQQAAVFIDARSAEDFAAGHIPGSLSLSYHRFTSRYPAVCPRLPRDRPLIIYCYGSSCGLSIRLAKRLLSEGHGKLSVLEGGMAAWEQAALPTASGEADP